jgi:hypothetical protein
MTLQTKEQLDHHAHDLWWHGRARDLSANRVAQNEVTKDFDKEDR